MRIDVYHQGELFHRGVVGTDLAFKWYNCIYGVGIVGLADFADVLFLQIIRQGSQRVIAAVGTDKTLPHLTIQKNIKNITFFLHDTEKQFLHALQIAGGIGAESVD